MKRFLILLLLLSLPISAEPLKLGDFTLDSPLEFGPVERLGVGAVSATYPADKPYKEITVELVVIHHSASAVATMKEGGGTISDSTRMTFLGSAAKAEEINKTLFLGKTRARKVYSGKIPRPHRLHTFESFLPDGGYVMVAVRAFGSNPKVGSLLQSIANTFKSAPSE